MLDSFENIRFIEQKFNELKQALEDPGILLGFGQNEPITQRCRNNSDNSTNWDKIHQYFVAGRKLTPPSLPQTTDDSLIYIIQRQYYNLTPEQIIQAREYHLQAMAAENFTGQLLERFIASILEQFGWIWCSGNVVRAVDFIEPHSKILLQIKNRDNSENSSSSAIRQNSLITKWFRLFSRKSNTDNWINFPLPNNQEYLRPYLNENNFLNFADQYLQELRALH